MLKKTARGDIGIHLEKGAINKFHVISKVFSFLNVSQLLRLRLPDMKSSGMPYDSIDGNFSFNDGSVSSRDLSISSPSINMTIVGNADLVKEEMDLMVGVQPLQTVGKIVSHIPIIGKILTRREQRLLVTYYKASGTWDDPKVESVPVTSLTRGVINIYNSLLNLNE